MSALTLIDGPSFKIFALFDRDGAQRSPSMRLLYEYLVDEHQYPGSYRNIVRYIHQQYPGPKIRPFRRVETPAGAQSQSDWGERWVTIGGQSLKRYAFLMVLSHSRKNAIVWSDRMDTLAWLHVHNGAYRRLGGVAAVNRVDNCKTAIVSGCGAWGKINAQYKSYARQMRFHIDACRVRTPRDKGKVERRVQVLDTMGLCHQDFANEQELQSWTDQRLARLACRCICPATGKTIQESFIAEQPFLGDLPQTIPEPFDLVKTCLVARDCTVRFEGRTYLVPFQYVEQTVEIRGCASQVHVLDPLNNKMLVQYPRHSAERNLFDPKCLDGESTDRVHAPVPLGRMSRKLAEIMQTPVEQRPVDLYAALAEVAR